MRCFSLVTLAAFALLFTACTTPLCPHNMVQHGHTCSLCPEGSEKKMNQCFKIDGGMEVDAVEADEDAQVEEGDPDSATSNDDDSGTSADSGAASTTSDAGTTMDGATPVDSGDGDDASNAATTDAAVDAGPPCYADQDKDGVGAGPAVSCVGYGSDAGTGPALSLVNNDCDDSNAQRSPRLSDICGDHIDNDCDGTPDDEANNACGGACTTQLVHQPNEACTNGLLGACARTGKYVCQGTTVTVCNAPSVAAGVEVCGDGLDNDCDGSIDEADATNSTTWYADCDGDGYAKVGAQSVTACAKPTPLSGCSRWTSVKPVINSTADCQDSSQWYAPGAPFGVPRDNIASYDLNCDGMIEKDNGIGQVAIDGVLVSSILLCPLSDGCQTCEQRSTLGGARWLESGTPTAAQPRCSANPTDGFAFQFSNSGAFTSMSSCMGGSGGWYSSVGGGLQLCR